MCIRYLGKLIGQYVLYLQSEKNYYQNYFDYSNGPYIRNFETHEEFN